MQDIHRLIREKEREMERLKAQFSLGKASLSFSKKHIRELEKDISLLAKRLPAHERELFLIRKEFGKEF